MKQFIAGLVFAFLLSAGIGGSAWLHYRYRVKAQIPPFQLPKK